MSSWLATALDSSARGFGAVLGGIGAAHAARQVESALHNLAATPNLITCPYCKHSIPVSDSVWTWRCLANPSGRAGGHACEHLNGKQSTSCLRCGAGKPKMPDPHVCCSNCAREVRVPTTNLVASLRRIVPPPSAAKPIAPAGGQQAALRPTAPMPIAVPLYSHIPQAAAPRPPSIDQQIEGLPNHNNRAVDEQPGMGDDADWTLLHHQPGEM